MKFFILISSLIFTSGTVSAFVKETDKNVIDTTRLRRFRCYPMYQDSEIGLSYGMLNHLYGVKIYKYTAWGFGLRLSVATDMEWRLPRKGNSYFNMEFTRHGIRDFYGENLAFSAGYKRMVSNFLNVTEQFYIGLGIFRKSYGLILGYARQHQRIAESPILLDNGVKLLLYKEYLDHLAIRLSAIYWFDHLQYSIKINEDLFQSGFIIGVGWEKIGSWKEFDVSLRIVF